MMAETPLLRQPVRTSPASSRPGSQSSSFSQSPIQVPHTPLPDTITAPQPQPTPSPRTMPNAYQQGPFTPYQPPNQRQNSRDSLPQQRSRSPSRRSSSTSSNRAPRPAVAQPQLQQQQPSPWHQSPPRANGYNGHTVTPVYSNAGPKPPGGAASQPRKIMGSLLSGASKRLIVSYIFDWVWIIALGAVGAILDKVSPHMRSFMIDDPNIAFPYTEKELIPIGRLLLLAVALPALVILVVTLIFVPGNTVPLGTPKSLIWKRKAWEIHASWMGLAFSLATAFFFTATLKNLLGRPRPDMLDRCQPDVARLSEFYVGGYRYDSEGKLQKGLLISAEICQQTDKYKLDDGFRSFPSGHSSAASAGLLYLSLFLVTKFAVTFPLLPLTSLLGSSHVFSAFPSRMMRGRQRDPSSRMADGAPAGSDNIELQNFAGPGGRRRSSSASSSSPLGRLSGGTGSGKGSRSNTAARLLGATPPIYLITVAMAPTFIAAFIAATRWYDHRHNTFDIFFGFAIGVVAAILAFRYFHLPMASGAGWAWGPRATRKAFWAGIGNTSFAVGTDGADMGNRAVSEKTGAQASGAGVGPTGGGPSIDLEAQQQQQRQRF